MLKKKIAFKGGILQKDIKFKKGTPNCRTLGVHTTSASTSNVSISTAQLLAKKKQHSKLMRVDGEKAGPQNNNNNNNNGKKTKKSKRNKKKAVPDFFTPEKGVLLLGTLRPNGLQDRDWGGDSGSGNGRPSSPSQQVQELVVPRAPESHAPTRSSTTAVRILKKSSTSHSTTASSTTAATAATTTTTTTEPPSIVLSWQHLGSPVRRMKRAMRFVQQNTCVTQRVTVDVGNVARLVIPCFEGITTVSDLVETVHCRFPSYGISGLRQPGTDIGRHAWDAHHHRVEKEPEEATTNFSPTGILNPHDFVSVAVGSDAALVAVGLNIPTKTASEENDRRRAPFGNEGTDDMEPMSAREEEQLIEEQRIIELTTGTPEQTSDDHPESDGGGGGGGGGGGSNNTSPPTAEFRHSLLERPAKPTEKEEGGGGGRECVQEDDEKEAVIDKKQEPNHQSNSLTPTQSPYKTSPQMMASADLKNKKSQSAMAMAVSVECCFIFLCVVECNRFFFFESERN